MRGVNKFAALVFGIKAKQCVRCGGLLVKFAALVFGIKAKLGFQFPVGYGLAGIALAPISRH